MQTNLPQKYSFNFFNKIKNFFKKIFFKEKIEIKYEIKKISNNNATVENQIEKMRKKSNDIKLKDEIIELVQKNPNLLETLSESRLDELEKLCDERISENDKKIEELENKYNKLRAKVAQ